MLLRLKPDLVSFYSSLNPIDKRMLNFRLGRPKSFKTLGSNTRIYSDELTDLEAFVNQSLDGDNRPSNGQLFGGIIKRAAYLKPTTDSSEWEPAMIAVAFNKNNFQEVYDGPDDLGIVECLPSYRENINNFEPATTFDSLREKMIEDEKALSDKLGIAKEQVVLLLKRFMGNHKIFPAPLIDPSALNETIDNLTLEDYYTVSSLLHLTEDLELPMPQGEEILEIIQVTKK